MTHRPIGQSGVTIDRAKMLEWLQREVPHHDCEDCWYSCATICCDDRRRSDKCDCGADEENAMRKAIAALL